MADQNIDQPIVDRLRSDGHSVFSIRDQLPGVDDDVVLAVSVRRNALLLTEDTDFGRLIFQERFAARGILLVRIIDVSSGMTADQIALLVSDVITRSGSSLFGQFTVLTDRGIRQHPLP